MGSRARLVGRLAAEICGLPLGRVVRVGVDGVDGAGKTVFADELGAAVAGLGRSVVRAGVDDFHRPRAARYRLGRDSPDGYFLEAFDYPLLARALLDPLSPGGSGRYRVAAFDYRADRAVECPELVAAERAVLVMDGVFLHRAELRGYWDFSVFLRVGFGVSVARCAARDGTSPDPEAPANRRYVEAQRRYLRECSPERLATVVVDNTDLAAPKRS